MFGAGPSYEAYLYGKLLEAEQHVQAVDALLEVAAKEHSAGGFPLVEIINEARQKIADYLEEIEDQKEQL